MEKTSKVSNPRRLQVTLAFLGYSFIALTWLFCIPPGSNPDEWAHYLRALSLSHGSVRGDPAESYSNRSASAPQESYLRQTATWVVVPQGHDPRGLGRNAFHPMVPAVAATDFVPDMTPSKKVVVIGPYQPFYYALPAAAIRGSVNAIAGIWRGRMASLLMSLLMLGLCFLCLTERSPHATPWLGLIGAMTPMVTYLMATLNSSGLEVSAGLGYFAAALLVTGEERPRRGAWVAFSVAGVVLILSRPTGLQWVLAQSVCLMLYRGRGALVARFRESRKPALKSLCGMGIAAAVALGWNTAYGARLTWNPRQLPGALTRALAEQVDWARQCAGVFQYLDTPMSTLGYECVGISLGAILVSAALVGNGRDRIALLGSLLWFATIPVLLFVFVIEGTGFGMQGRYILPFLVGLPLLAGDIVVRRTTRPVQIMLTMAVVPVALVAQFDGWWENGRRSAVGVMGPHNFIPYAQWNPPYGWPVWEIVTKLGCAMVLASAVLPCLSLLNERWRSVKPAKSWSSQPQAS